MSRYGVLGPKVTCVFLALILGVRVTSASGGSIFDEESFKPVKEDEPARTPATPAPKPESPPAQSIPNLAPKSLTPSGSTETATRRPLPTQAAVAHSRELLKEAYVNALKDRSPTARRKVAQQLITDAAKMGDAPSDLYAVLSGAVNAAAEARSLPLAFLAIDRLCDNFDGVARLPNKRNLALQIPLKSDNPNLTGENIDTAMDLVSQLLETDDIDGAAKLCSILHPAAVGDVQRISAVAERTREVDAIRTAYEHVALQRTKLATAPQDPSSNLAVGSYYCFTRGDWAKGLPMLAKGSDAALQKLAADEAVAATHPGDLAGVGNRWWDESSHLSELARLRARQHAVSLYEVAIPTSVGLQRTLMQSRIEEVTAALNGSGIHSVPRTIQAARDPAVRPALARGVAYIIRQQNGDGNWEELQHPIDSKSDADVNGIQWGGTTALATYALLAAGEAENQKPLQASLQFLTTSKLLGVYALSLRLQALSTTADPAKYRQLMQQDYQLLVQGVKSNGMFGYLVVRPAMQTDMSCTQFGWLGIAAAEKVGVRVPREPWIVIAQSLLRSQKADGSWGYSSAKSTSSLSMTAAGATVLLMAKPYLSPELQVMASKSIESAIKSMNALDANRFNFAYTSLCLQRVGQLSGKSDLAGVDWYKSESASLLKSQHPDGSWGNVQDSSMAVLFLAKGPVP